MGDEPHRFVRVSKIGLAKGGMQAAETSFVNFSPLTADRNSCVCVLAFGALWILCLCHLRRFSFFSF